MNSSVHRVMLRTSSVGEHNPNCCVAITEVDDDADAREFWVHDERTMISARQDPIKEVDDRWR